MSITQSNKPLCIDLDGTLIRSDILMESVFALLKLNIAYVFLLPIWLLKGKANIKHQIALRVDLDVTLLPFNEKLLAYVREQKAQGRRLILATASNIKYAEQINFHLGLFDDVLASDETTNLSGSKKSKRLVEAFGDQGFNYAGNEEVDLKIWRNASGAILVNVKPALRKKVEKVSTIIKEFNVKRNKLKTYIKAIRLHQWMKNLLIFVPLITAHKVLDYQLLLNGALAFLAFGLCASSVYLLNDLLDLPSDRKHPVKCERPLASGALPILNGILFIPILLILAFIVAAFLPVEFLIVLAFYYIVTMAYSFRLKSVSMVDVLTLAGLYTVRIIAGATAVSVTPSFWLLAFSMFLFLSLALVKRYTELLNMQKAGTKSVLGRGYYVSDIEGLAQFGSASGYLAVLVLALYINSSDVEVLYKHPEFIWLFCPLLLYWISRMWLMARRNELHEDPVLFAIRDRRSHWMGVLGFVIFWVAV